MDIKDGSEDEVMDIKDSSEDEEIQNISAFTKFDESIEVRNAEEIKSPVNPRPSSSRKNRRYVTTGSSDMNLSREKHSFKRYTDHENFEKSLGMSSDISDSEETDDDDIQGTSTTKQLELYDPKEFEDLDVSTEVKELLQNIIRYTPQKIDLNYKLIPFIPDYIPAVGDIDAFIKIPRPDGVKDKIGLSVLDEPCTDQSEPAVLHLQLRTHCRSAGAQKQAVIKRIEDASVQTTKPMPDIDALMQQWPSEVEDKLNEVPIDFTILDCELSRLVDIVCNLLDIPSQNGSRLEALHTLFTLFLEIRNVAAQKI